MPVGLRVDGRHCERIGLEFSGQGLEQRHAGAVHDVGDKGRLAALSENSTQRPSTRVRTVLAHERPTPNPLISTRRVVAGTCRAKAIGSDDDTVLP